MTAPRAWLAWSSGKDSAWALRVARQAGELDVVALLTTVTDDHRRVSMHGVRETLLHAQAGALGLPLHVVRIPAPCPQEVYDDAMRHVLRDAREEGVTHVVFGDLFLADVRAHREERLAEVGMAACFPLWQRDSAALAREIIADGTKSVVVCVDPAKAPREIAGRAYDEELLASLPASVDPCGENGEFHTFVWDCPSFARPVAVRVGETVERDGFLFTDLLPAPQR
ncbi:MAG: adenine nucleotide alpha hydrolase [Dehalococcoidia bacterium]|nr:adenine nucleotide alpha hydrolase [Dehalococcoidia bacterium]